MDRIIFIKYCYKWILCVLLVFILSSLKAQNQLVIENVKVRKNEIRFSLTNYSKTDFIFADLPAKLTRGGYIPFYYSINNDTLQVFLFNENWVLQSGHFMTDSVIIEGVRSKNKRYLKAGGKFKFSIPTNDFSRFPIVLHLKLEEDYILSVVLYGHLPSE